MTFIQHGVGSANHGNQRRKIKRIQIGKEAELLLLADDITLHKENPKDATRKLLELIDDFGKVAAYKINIQKSLVFLCNNSKRSEREIKETIPSTISSR